MYEITYELQKSFTVHLPDRNILFHRWNQLYIAEIGVVTEEAAATRAYTKAEEMHAQVVLDLIQNFD
jgi:hypothetical protein